MPGFDEDFLMIDWSEIGEPDGKQTSEQVYSKIVTWARMARRHNPRVFDALTTWILDDSQWGEDKIVENEQVFMRGVVGRFKEQNNRLRSYLEALAPGGVVNPAVFPALDRFDHELSGVPHDQGLRDPVARMFHDFFSMQERSVRELVAGSRTGPTGTDTVEVYGYVNHLKDRDAAVQWALFMPVMVEGQQKGFKVESFEYRTMPAMRFIGQECTQDDSPERREEVSQALQAMGPWGSGFDHDVLFMHHYGLGVDRCPWRGFWGRFMKANAPVSEGFVSFEFVPRRDQSEHSAGPPYYPQFAFATFSGDADAMHRRQRCHVRCHKKHRPGSGRKHPLPGQVLDSGSVHLWAKKTQLGVPVQCERVVAT